jgi:SAM-dependent methyltransferase
VVSRGVLRGVRAAYDAVAADYAEHIGGELAGKPADRALLDALAIRAGGGPAGGGVTGDLGAGPGHVAGYLAGRGARVVAVDLSPRMLAAGGAGVPAVAGDLLALPLRDGCLAAAVAFYSLIHLPVGTETAALGEIRRVLAPGGELVAAVHVGEKAEHFDEWWGHEVSVDFRHFLVPQLTGWMEAAGLPVVEVTERDHYPAVEAPTHRAYVRAVRPDR